MAVCGVAADMRVTIPHYGSDVVTATDQFWERLPSSSLSSSTADCFIQPYQWKSENALSTET